MAVLVVSQQKPPPADAAAKLRSFALYPSARAVSLSGNSQYEKASQDWRFQSNGFTVTSDRLRSLAASVATLTFETSDDPDKVYAFYDETVGSYYSVISPSGPGHRYIDYVYILYPRWIAEYGSDITGRAVDEPLTVYQLDVHTTTANKQAGSGLPGTHVVLEFTIFHETGGLFFSP